MDTLILVLEIIGTVAFAASGAMTGVKKNMDIFGVVILGLTTAVGGGVIRDLILAARRHARFRTPLRRAIDSGVGSCVHRGAARAGSRGGIRRMISRCW